MIGKKSISLLSVRKVLVWIKIDNFYWFARQQEINFSAWRDDKRCLFRISSITNEWF